MAPRRVDYVIFDMDGLLIDSERIYTEVTNKILGPYGCEMTWDIKAGVMGKPEVDATAYLLSHFPSVPLSVPDYIALAAKLKSELFPTVQALPGAIKLVTHFHTNNVPIALATSSSRSSFLLKSTHLQDSLFKYFGSKVICADDGLFDKNRGKPCPDIFLAAAGNAMLGFDVGSGEGETVTGDEKMVRARGLVFEDAIPGVEAAKRAGMGVIWIPDNNLLAVSHVEPPDVDQRLESLEHFVPEEWGLPPYPT